MTTRLEDLLHIEELLDENADLMERNHALDVSIERDQRIIKALTEALTVARRRVFGPDELTQVDAALALAKEATK